MIDRFALTGACREQLIKLQRIWVKQVMRLRYGVYELDQLIEGGGDFALHCLLIVEYGKTATSFTDLALLHQLITKAVSISKDKDVELERLARQVLVTRFEQLQQQECGECLLHVHCDEGAHIKSSLPLSEAANS